MQHLLKLILFSAFSSFAAPDLILRIDNPCFLLLSKSMKNIFALKAFIESKQFFSTLTHEFDQFQHYDVDNASELTSILFVANVNKFGIHEIDAINNIVNIENIHMHLFNTPSEKILETRLNTIFTLQKFIHLLENKKIFSSVSRNFIERYPEILKAFTQYFKSYAKCYLLWHVYASIQFDDNGAKISEEQQEIRAKQLSDALDIFLQPNVYALKLIDFVEKKWRLLSDDFFLEKYQKQGICIQEEDRKSFGKFAYLIEYCSDGANKDIFETDVSYILLLKTLKQDIKRGPFEEYFEKRFEEHIKFLENVVNYSISNEFVQCMNGKKMPKQAELAWKFFLERGNLDKFALNILIGARKTSRSFSSDLSNVSSPTSSPTSLPTASSPTLSTPKLLASSTPKLLDLSTPEPLVLPKSSSQLNTSSEVNHDEDLVNIGSLYNSSLNSPCSRECAAQLISLKQNQQLNPLPLKKEKKKKALQKTRYEDSDDEFTACCFSSKKQKSKNKS